jgi:hypothetical protein
MEKRETEEKSNEEVSEHLSESVKKKQKKQIQWIVGLMIIVILVISIFPTTYNYLFNQFSYAGLKFQKTKLHGLVFYSTMIPLTKKMPVPGQSMTEKDVIGNYPINLRSDPRQIEYIKINLSSEAITFKKMNTVYISLNPEMEKCSDNTLALVNFAGFLKDFGSMKIKSAISDKASAEESNITFVTCENHPTNTVINIQSGNETSIKKVNNNCYYLTYNKCEIISVTERLQLLIIEGYMNHFYGNFVEEDDGYIKLQEPNNSLQIMNVTKN